MGAVYWYHTLEGLNEFEELVVILSQPLFGVAACDGRLVCQRGPVRV
jgi:hypothetical protein